MKVNKKILLVASAILSGSMISTPALQYFPQNIVAAVDAITFDRATLQKGQVVSVKGTVMSDVNVWGGQSFYLETENGQGIFVYPKEDLAVKKGNVVSFKATVDEYGGQLQLGNIKDYKLESPSGSATAKTKEISELSNPLLRDTYINLDNVVVKNIKSVGKFKNTNFTVEDKAGNVFNVFVDNRSGADYGAVSAKVANGNTISVKGFLGANKSGQLELKVNSLDEITVTSSDNKPTAVNEVANIGEIQGEAHTSPMLGKDVKVRNVVVTKIVNNKGFYVQDLAPDNNPKTSDAIYVVSKEKVKVGDKLVIEGLVQEGYGDGYADKTKTDLSITQLVAKSVEKDGTANLPAPIDISAHMPKNIIDNDQFSKFDPEEDAIDYWESIEGMLVNIKQPKVLGPQLHGEIYVLPGDYSERTLNNAGGLNLNPNYHTTEVIPVLVGDRKYRAKAKDYFTEDIQGVVTYTYGSYKVEALKMPQIHDGNLVREVSNLLPSEDKLTIASYNIENFSANSSAKETPEAKVEKIANSFINQIHNPDIITLIEVQDNNGGVDDGTVDGTQSGKRLADKIKALGGVEYSYTEVAPVNNVDGGKPGANIRVAFLYNPNRVQLVGNGAGESNEAAKFENGHLAKNPSRIAPTNPAFDSVRKSLAAEFKFKDENVVVIANHLKSKRGDDSLYGKKQPAVENSQASRIEQAKIINEFVKSGLSQNPNLKFVLTGDFNDYEFSKTINAVAGNELVSLLTDHEETDRYSYFYRGNNQSLDNILVSKNILDKSKFDAVHVNSSFMEEDGRASDHDPLVVQIDFSKKVETAKGDQSNNGAANVQPELPEGKVPSENGGIKVNDNLSNGSSSRYPGTSVGTTGEVTSNNSDKSSEDADSDDNGKKDNSNNKDSKDILKNKDKRTSSKENRVLAKTGIATTSFLSVLGGLLIAAVVLLRKKLSK